MTRARVMYKIESYTAVFFAVTTKYIYIYIYSLPRRLPRESTAAKAGAITHKDDDVRWNEEQCLSLHRGLSLSLCLLFFFFWWQSFRVLAAY